MKLRRGLLIITATMMMLTSGATMAFADTEEAAVTEETAVTEEIIASEDEAAAPVQETKQYNSSAKATSGTTDIRNCTFKLYWGDELDPRDDYDTDPNNTREVYFDDDNEAALQTPDVEVYDKKINRYLTEGKDYTVSYSDSRNAGSYMLFVTGKGKYSATKGIQYRITPIDLSKVKVGDYDEEHGCYFGWEVKDRAYTGKPLGIKFEEFHFGPYEFKKNVDYDLNDVTITNNTNMGKAKVNGYINFHGNFKGSVPIHESFIIAPNRTKFLKLKGGKKKFTATWKKSPYADGYIIECSRLTDDEDGYSKTFIVKGANKTKKTFKLKYKGYYDVEIYAYKKVNGHKYFHYTNHVRTVKVK